MAENQMVKPQKVGKKVRMSFSKIEEPIQMPDLLEVQKGSYRWFMEKGIQEVLEDVSPIVDYSGNLFIDFVSFSIDESKVKYPVEECKERDANYAAPLKVDVRLSNKLTGEVKQSEIFMGDFPIMTDKGTFVINGARYRFADRSLSRNLLFFGYRQNRQAHLRHYGDPVPRRMA